MRSTHVPGVAVEILVDGEPLQEYEHPDHPEEGGPTRKVTRYIEAMSGKRFQVRIQYFEDFHRPWRSYSTEMNLFIDGNMVKNWPSVRIMPSYTPNSDPTLLEDQTLIDGYRYQADGEDFIQHFEFADLDPENVGRQGRRGTQGCRAASLGTIHVRLLPLMAWMNGSLNGAGPYPKDTTISRKTDLKEIFKSRNVSHCVRVGQGERASETLVMCNITNLQYLQDGTQDFVFHFVGQSILETMGLVGGSSAQSTELPSVLRDPKDMTREELEDFVRQSLCSGQRPVIKQESPPDVRPLLKRKVDDEIEAEGDGDVTFVETRPAKAARTFFEDDIL